MTTSFVHKAIVEFKPDPDWQWETGFDGMVELTGSTSAFNFDGQPFCLKSDLLQLANALAAKPYSAKGFDDTPGKTGQATISIDESTLCNFHTDDGEPTVVLATVGKFTVSDCSPSFKSGASPKPDPKFVLHTGAFAIFDSVENATKVGESCLP